MAGLGFKNAAAKRMREEAVICDGSRAKSQRRSFVGCEGQRQRMTSVVGSRPQSENESSGFVSLLDDRSQTFDRVVPLGGGARQVVTRLRDGIRTDRESTLPTHALARDNASVPQNLQMLRHALSRQTETAGKLHDRVLLPVAEPGKQLEARAIAKRCEHGSRTECASPRHESLCVWPECPSPPCSSAALPVACFPGTAESRTR